VLAPVPCCSRGRAEDAGSLLASSSSPPHLQAALRNKGVVGVGWGLGGLSVLLLWLGHVYTLAVATQSSPEFAPVSICRAATWSAAAPLLNG